MGSHADKSIFSNCARRYCNCLWERYILLLKSILFPYMGKACHGDNSPIIYIYNNYNNNNNYMCLY